MFKKLFSKKGKVKPQTEADSVAENEPVNAFNAAPNTASTSPFDMNVKEYINSPDAKMEGVKKEYTFYQDQYRRLVKISFVLAVSLGLIAITDFYKMATHKDTIETFFVTNQNNQIIPIKPVTEPYPDADVTNWAASSVMDIYTLGPLDFRKRVSVDFQRYFSPDALKDYRQAIASRLARLSENSESMTANPSGSPVIINKGILDHRYYWQIMLPIQITYVSGRERITELRRVVMNVVRADQTRYPTGLIFTSIDESEPINSKSL